MPSLICANYPGSGNELEKLVVSYVDTYRRLLNGSTSDELLTSLINDPWKTASIAEKVGNAFVNGSLGYYDGLFLNLRPEFPVLFGKLHALYDGIQMYLAAEKKYDGYQYSCWGDGPCFVRTLDSFDILTESTGRLLKSVAAPFKNLVYHYASYDIHDLLKEASEQKEDANSLDLVDRCGWQYHASKHGACNTVECALQAIDRVMGPTCEETDSDTLEEFYGCYGCRKGNLTAVENRCFHKFLMRYSNYSARIYDSFVGTIGTYLLMELDVFGFCRHIAEAKTAIANFTERRQAVVNLVRGISKRLVRDKKILEEHAGSPKNWTELARSVVHASIDYVANGRDLPYPSPGRAVEKYQEVSEAIIKRIHANNFNKETYRYEIILYKPGSGLGEVCLINSNDDVVRDNYKNVNYLFSRVGRRLTSVLASRIQKENATIQASFGNNVGNKAAVFATLRSSLHVTAASFSESTKKDLCERVRGVEDKLKYKFTGEGGFRTMLVTRCARKFVWYELAWQHFRAAWSTADNQIFVSSGNYDTQCVSVVLIP